MRYIVSAILNKIYSQNPVKEEQLRIRICGFEDIRIYEAVARELHEKFDDILDVETRLSKEKWEEFKKDPTSNQTALASIEAHEWVAEKNSLTYYRNLPLSKAQLIVVMGTELVDDQGGLSDFYFIDPEKLTRDLEQNYFDIFEQNMGDHTEDDRNTVNKLYKDLFALVPANICKLSDIADRWGKIDTIQFFVERFYLELPVWGLCTQSENVPATGKILKNVKTNLLQTNYDFISRRMFKKMTQRQYAKYLTKIAKYQAEQKKYEDSWSGWKSQGTKSLFEYTDILCSFIRGENINSSRKRLLDVDYGITEYVLGIDLPTILKPTKPKKYAVVGSPYTAFLKAICTSAAAEDAQPFDTLRITVSSIELANAVDPLSDDKEDTQLINAWRKVCWFAGGVIKYIEDRGFEVGGREISVEVEDTDPFDPRCAQVNLEAGIILKASASKKLDKVRFEIVHICDGKATDVRHSFEWNFSLHDDWAIAFEQLFMIYEQWITDQVDSAIPIATVSNYEELMGAKCEEEFLDYYEQSVLDFKINLAEKALEKSEEKWQAEFSHLGRCFVDFCKYSTEKGFFTDIRVPDASKACEFLNRYTSLGSRIVGAKFTDDLEWVMDYYIHAFAIEESIKPITTNEEAEGCIIPPYHPAILQKIIDRIVFIADGCKEWLQENEESHASFDKICSVIDELIQLSQIQEGVDIFPSKGKEYFGTTRAFANFCICGSCKKTMQKWMKSIMQKDAVFDDDFSDGTLKRMNVSAKMLLDVIDTYVKAMPNSAANLSIAVIDPDDLQPVIAALYQYISKQKKELADSHQVIQIRLNILVKPENRGGKNYLSYWANTFFNQDENVDMKIYLNEWRDTDDLKKLLDTNLDLLFMMDVLKVETLDFIKDDNPREGSPSSCRFPIVFKPTPVTSTKSVNRKIELTQNQFSAATIHSQVVYYRRQYENHDYQKSIVVRKVTIDGERKKLILMLHQKSNWVICVDGGMDGALLRDDGNNTDYAVIGFSTGKGPHGQYNLTITARNSIINAVEAKLKRRLQNAFLWDKSKTLKAAKNCMNEARNLDGISLLNAINPRDNSINEFLAYVMASLQAKKSQSKSALQVVVHLDSYQHWFENNVLEENVESKSRPDFLEVSANLGDDGMIELDATVIECKIAKYEHADERKKDAIEQVNHGIDRLSKIFDPSSQSIRRRYWFAQLYRALAFSQITFIPEDQNSFHFAGKLREILDGEFRIKWSGKIVGYWKDMAGDNEIVTQISSDPIVEMREVPQKKIQRILLDDDDAEVEYVQIIDDDENTGDTDEPEEGEIENDEVRFVPGMNTATETDDASKESDKQIKSDGPTEEAVMEPDNPEKSADAQGNNDIPKKRNHSQKKTLEEVRVFIGTDKYNNKVYWDFGHPKLANRHLLITGTSGQGKTYSIQAMLRELAQNGISSVIFDYTEGFREDQLEPPFRNALADRIKQNIVYFTGIPIDPFRRQEIEIAGMRMPEKISDVAQRIATIFTHVYDFGEQQFAAIYEACSSAITAYGDQADMNKFREKLAEVKNSAAKTVMSKMMPFFDTVEFKKDETFDWNTVINADGAVIIFQLTNYVREIQVIITEMMLWDAWYYFKKNGDKNSPFVVVLDEAQNLSMKMGSPAEVILREGRKFGWSAWFATQSLKSLSDIEVVNLHQAPYSLYFKPTDDEIVKISKQIDPVSSSSWVSNLKSLHKGQCIVTGDRVKSDGSFGAVKPTITNITSFEERENDE